MHQSSLTTFNIKLLNLKKNQNHLCFEEMVLLAREQLQDQGEESWKKSIKPIHNWLPPGSRSCRALDGEDLQPDWALKGCTRRTCNPITNDVTSSCPAAENEEEGKIPMKKRLKEICTPDVEPPLPSRLVWKKL